MFDEPMLRGAGGQPAFAGLKLTHFQDKRSPELSLDRLGATGVERRVREHLIPRAEAAGTKFNRPLRFDGWCVVAAKELTNARQEPKFPVIASPVNEPEPLDNPYHAHVVRPDTLSVHLMSLQLRHIFTAYGGVERNEAIETPEPGLLERAHTWISKTWAWLFSAAGYRADFIVGSLCQASTRARSRLLA
jgi:hypothetical protein